MQLTHKNSDFKKKAFPLVLVLDHVTGPANIGSLFRLADAFGVEKILICGPKVELSSNRLKRTARGTIDSVAFQVIEDCEAACEDLTKDGYSLTALEISSTSTPIDSVDFKKVEKLALIVGNERLGISEKLLKMTKNQVHINMFGRNSSMNVAQAAGIALFEITKTLQPIP